MTGQRTARRPATGSPTTESIARRIGPRVRARRVELGLSLRELARRIDVSASFVSLVETGRCPPSVGTLCALSTELGVSADELLADPELSASGATALRIAGAAGG